MSRSNDHRYIAVFAIVILGLCVAGAAQAQAWNENNLAWDSPNTCTTGEPISACPVTGYKVERSSTATGTYATVGTTTATTFKHTAVSGQNCYRVRATYAAGETAPTNVVCVTNTPPAGPPNPPTNLRTISTTVYNVKPNLQKWAFERGPKVPGTYVKAQSACDENRCVTDTREGNFCVVSRLTQIVPRPEQGSVLMALCG